LLWGRSGTRRVLGSGGRESEAIGDSQGGRLRANGNLRGHQSGWHEVRGQGYEGLPPHLLGVDSTGAEKWRLNSEVSSACGVVVDAHGHQ
jgi:hypothetical protein